MIEESQETQTKIQFKYEYIGISDCHIWIRDVGTRQKEDQRFEMWFWGRIIENIVEGNNQFGNRVTLCQRIDKINLQYIGHIARREDDNLEKIIAQGHVEERVW